MLNRLIEANNGVVINQDITYIGYQGNVIKNIYGSANDYYSFLLPDVQLNMLSTTASNYRNITMKSIEFIVIHDTGSSASSSTASANSNWCLNETNTSSSWHYTIGNDGIYKQIEDNIVALHAGDGISWSSSTILYDTGVVYEGDRPQVTVESDGYFYINNKKTLVMAPSGYSTINDLGLVCFKGTNNNYVIPTTYIGSYGDTICARGGNLNGIGIETCVNSSSDVYLTWQITAKFVASLLIEHNLTPDRVWFHNNFSNKACPGTMMAAGLVDEFLELVYTEYDIAKNYSDYTITFESSNPSLLDNSGRVVGTVDATTNVEYKIKVTKGGNTEEITLNSVIIGKNMQ